MAKQQKSIKKKIKKTVTSGRVSIYASYNNTIVTIAENNGNTLAWATAGSSGFKGARKATPYAGQIAAQKAVEKVSGFGFNEAIVYINGIGPGREQAIRGLISAGVSVKGIIDTTAIPHNGCRIRKARRV